MRGEVVARVAERVALRAAEPVAPRVGEPAVAHRVAEPVAASVVVAVECPSAAARRAVAVEVFPLVAGRVAERPSVAVAA